MKTLNIFGKNTAKAVLAGFVALSSVGALAQNLPGTRTGFVNIERLFTEANAAKVAQAKLQREFSAREKKVQDQGNALKKAVEQFQQESPKMTEANRAAKERQLMIQDNEFQKNRREFQEDLNSRKNDEMQAFIQKANRAVEEVAKKEQFDKIDQEAVYINPKIDITDKVLDFLNSGN